MSYHWTMTEWSSPSFALIAAMFACVATLPAMRYRRIAAGDDDEDEVDDEAERREARGASRTPAAR